ncbi:MAG: tryptophan 7-halogenase [Planctomycetaceae bacterium]|nr:tryptophan 7-halogenase [Planctomycetaceae bacterium]
MIQSQYTPSKDFQRDVAESYDVIVIGGGPAGATTATLLAEHGHSVLILERSTIPRFHIGESLIPETYWPLKRLGLIDRLKESAFPKKFSVQFVSDGWKESAPFYFDEHNAHESSQTWQVERADFDRMLLDNAISKGVTVRSCAQVLDLIFEDEQVVGVRVKLPGDSDEDTETREIRSRVVCDASGLSTFLANRLGLKNSDPILRKGTVWSYFKGAQRDPGKDEGATLIMQTEGKHSWFWYIPLRDDVVSVGCTGDMHYMFPKGASAEETFARELERCPAMSKRLGKATRCLDFFTTKDYSYRSRQAAGDGWVLVGDAYGFIDPVYSSGVLLALRGGEFVADAVHDALQANDISGARLGHWKAEFDAGLENFRRLVYAFYAPDFSFGDFLREHPQFKSNLVDVLIGAVFKPGVGDMFEVMGDIRPAPVEPVASEGMAKA